MTNKPVMPIIRAASKNRATAEGAKSRIARLKQRCVIGLRPSGWAEIEAVQTDYIERLPAADVAPVVRCKDCKYGDYDSKPDGAMVCLRTKDGFWRKETDFCSYGERKDNDEH